MLTPKREKFAQARAGGMHQTDAYREAFNTTKMKPQTIWTAACVIDADSKVISRVKELKDAIDAASVMSMAAIRDLVLQDATDILRADPSELVTHRRLNCRHCHGIGHAYRWIDEEEFWRTIADASERAEASGKAAKLPTDEGGYGFRRLGPPSPTCPRCEGEGLEDVRLADVRTLSGPARRMYAGVKVTRNGVEIAMRDKDSARALLANYAGMLKQDVKLGGVVGLTPVMPAELTEAQRALLHRALEDDV